MKLPILQVEKSLELKELGFNWETTSKWHDGYLYPSWVLLDIPDPGIPAPTQALTCKWFRDKHSMSIEVAFTYKGYTCLVYDTEANELWSQLLETFPSYDQAELEGITEAIKLLKE